MLTDVKQHIQNLLLERSFCKKLLTVTRPQCVPLLHLQVTEPRQRLAEVNAHIQRLLVEHDRPTRDFFAQKPSSTQGGRKKPKAAGGGKAGQKRAASDDDRCRFRLRNSPSRAFFQSSNQLHWAEVKQRKGKSKPEAC